MLAIHFIILEHLVSADRDIRFPFLSEKNLGAFASISRADDRGPRLGLAARQDKSWAAIDGFINAEMR